MSDLIAFAGRQINRVQAQLATLSNDFQLFLQTTLSTLQTSVSNLQQNFTAFQLTTTATFDQVFELINDLVNKTDVINSGQNETLELVAGATVSIAANSNDVLLAATNLRLNGTNTYSDLSSSNIVFATTDGGDESIEISASELTVSGGRRVRITNDAMVMNQSNVSGDVTVTKEEIRFVNETTASSVMSASLFEMNREDQVMRMDFDEGYLQFSDSRNLFQQANLQPQQLQLSASTAANLALTTTVLAPLIILTEEINQDGDSRVTEISPASITLSTPTDSLVIGVPGAADVPPPDINTLLTAGLDTVTWPISVRWVEVQINNVAYKMPAFAA